MIGTTVSHYQILDKLGSGGMGVVYRARDLKLDRIVALKFLSSELNLSGDERRRFVREAKAASALDHPNIGVVFDIDETSDGQTFIVMAYYPGQTLKQKIAASPPLDEIIGITIQVAQGLAKAHAQGIVHRDIKPSNVIVTADGVPKIIDFGLATVSDATLSIGSSSKGTPAYMSSEQSLGQDVDARTDLWALGVMLYEIVTGRAPFSGSSVAAILFEVVHQEPKRPHELHADVDPELERIVLKALAKKREDRYSTATELARDLAAFRTGLSAPPLTTVAPVATRAVWRKPIAIVACLAMVLLTAGGLFRITSWQREHQRVAADVARLTRDGEFASAFTRAKATGPRSLKISGQRCPSWSTSRPRPRVPRSAGRTTRRRRPRGSLSDGLRSPR
jgi:serine/threonine protein kinase